MKLWIWLAALSAEAVWLYGFIVFVLGEAVFGFDVRYRHLLPAAIIGMVALYCIIRLAVNRRWVSDARLPDLTLAMSVSLFCVLAVDIGYTVYLNRSGPETVQPVDDLADPLLRPSNLYFYPTKFNFRVFKPEISISGAHYGDFYYSSELLKSSTLVESVLQLKHVSFSTDKRGLRETTPLEDATVFALGDSFTAGYQVDQGKIWVELLEKATREPIYNLGVPGASPKQELMLLRWMLENSKDRVRIRHVLWMIYEGNDLEDSYDTLRPTRGEKEDNDHGLFKGTIVNTLLVDMPRVIKRQAVMTKVMAGRIGMADYFSTTNEADPYIIDGLRLIYPVYYSQVHGYRYFYPPLIRRANKTHAEVMNHPHRPLLDKSFKEMAALAERFQFKVTVLIAPQVSRLYGSYFDNFPPVTEEPHFADHIVQLSREMGFDTINLLELLAPYTQHELLYFRDDSHLNERGHEVVAAIVAARLLN